MDQELLETLRKYREERKKYLLPSIPVDKRDSQFAVLFTTDFKKYSGTCRIWQNSVGSVLHHIDNMCRALDANFNALNSFVAEVYCLRQRLEMMATTNETVDDETIDRLVQCLNSVAMPVSDSCVTVSRVATVMKECGQSVRKSMVRLQNELDRERAVSQTKVSRAKFTGGKVGRKSRFSNRPYQGQLRGRKTQQQVRTSTVAVITKKARSKRVTKVVRRKSTRLSNNGKRTARTKRRSSNNDDDDDDDDDGDSEAGSNSGNQNNRGSHGETQGNAVDVEDSAGEPLYCICRQVSYGQMICCDNDKCEMEWFHFKCVHLATKPKGKWYCPKCRDGRANKCKFDVKTEK